MAADDARATPALSGHVNAQEIPPRRGAAGLVSAGSRPHRNEGVKLNTWGAFRRPAHPQGESPHGHADPDPASRPVRPRIAELRRRAATTPGRLRLAMTVRGRRALLLAGVVAVHTLDVRRGAAASVASPRRAADGAGRNGSTRRSRTPTPPQPRHCSPVAWSRPPRRQRYLTALRSGEPSAHRARASRPGHRRGGGAPSPVVAAALPVYKRPGGDPRAPPNNRQGFPVGGRLPCASHRTSCASGFLPAAGRVYASEARRLAGRPGRRHPRAMVSPTALTALVLAPRPRLFGAQLFVARRTHRVFQRPGSLAATACVHRGRGVG